MEKQRSDAISTPVSDPNKLDKRRQSLTSSIHSKLLVAVLAAFFCVWISFKRSGDYLVCTSSPAIYTVYNDQVAQCLRVHRTEISDVGSREHLSRFRLSDLLYGTPAVINLQPGHIVVPGLADAHCHILAYGFIQKLPLENTRSISDVVQRLREYVLTHESEQWIEGWGWDQNKWPEPVFPTAADLGRDPLLKGRAIALSRIDGHAAWVSPAVLALMGTLPETVDGGSILRDAEGNPTGIFIDNAMDLIPRPPWTEHQIKEYFDATIRTALSYGLTTLHDAGSSPEHINFFKAQADAGKLPIRLYIMGLVSSDEYWGAQIPRLVDYGPQGRLNVRSVKLVTDGALGSWGAALLEPYSDKPEQRGILRQTAEVLAHIIRKFYEDGWQVNIHCIGDFANHLVLDIFENVLLRPDASVYKWRPRIEHAQIMTANDLERVGRLGVIASVQPTHATSDMSYAESRLGSERIRGAYAYGTLLNTSRLNIHSPGGGVLPLGSDFPVEPVNPLLGFYAAVTRLDTGGNSPHGSGGWFPSQRLTRAQALKGMTLDAAYAAFAEDQYGSIAVGKRADFVVLDHDIMQVPVADILNTHVVATVIDGEIMYGQLKV